MFNIPDYQHDLNRKEMDRLKELGFEFEVTADGYFVKFKGQGIGGARCANPGHRRFGKQAENDRRDHLNSALITAKQSEFFA